MTLGSRVNVDAAAVDVEVQELSAGLVQMGHRVIQECDQLVLADLEPADQKIVRGPTRLAVICGNEGKIDRRRADDGG